MAKTEQDIKGRLGNMIFYKVKGVTRIRSKAMMFRDRNSTQQQVVRKRFMVAVHFYQRLKEEKLSMIWKLATQNMVMSGYNLFMKYNINVFDHCTLQDPAHLILTMGELPPMINLEVKRQERGEVTLVWENSLNMEGIRANDHLQIVALFENRMFTPVLIEDIRACRQNRMVTLKLGEEKKGEVHLYCYFVSPDKHTYSPSYYISTTL